MPFFSKEFVEQNFDSLEAFALSDGCFKIYEVDNGHRRDYVSIRYPRDEIELFNSSSLKNPVLVWEKK